MATQRRSSVLRFQLEGVEGPGVEIGRGSYAVVEEYDFQGLSCVGKCIHENLYDSASPRERETMLGRFEGECEMLSRLRHPHIVQFLGVHFNEGSPVPVLLMERLHSTLAACVDRHGKLPDECCYSVLRDVGVGLRYLHSRTPNPIIHRDLTANNVLLTPDMSAKISDLGVTKILNLSPTRMTQLTTCPGTPSYMPPEALVARPIYSTNMDNFAYGNLMVHVFCGRWPVPGEAFRADPRDPNVMMPRTEMQRRDEYLNDIGDTHPLMGTMRQCLSNNPTARPNVFQILQAIKEVMRRFPTSFESRVDLLIQNKLLSDENTTLTEKITAQSDRITALSDKNAALSDENTALRMAGLSTAAVPMKLVSESQVLDSQCKPKWRRGADLPVAMHRPHLVKIGNNIYCGGGKTGKVDTARIVFKYNPTADTWSPLPPCPTYAHGLSELDNALVSVGGIMHNAPGFIPTNSVYKFQDPNWVTCLPPMPTARFDLSAFTYKIHLIACGGITSCTSITQYTCTTTVEMLNSETGQWSTLAPLPFALRWMSTAISNGRCYLIDGTCQEGLDLRACSAPLPLLIESASQPSPSSAVWEVLPNCPLFCSTAAELGGCVLALGGRIQGVASTDVYLYSRNSKSWRTTAVNLPIASYYATSATLAGDSIVVVGGLDKTGSCLNQCSLQRLKPKHL